MKMKKAMNSPAKILLLILFFFQPADAKTDWPNWGGPNRDFRINDAGVFPSDQPYALKIVWKKPLGPGYSPISVRGNLAVTMYSDEIFDYVIGLNTEDGSQRWGDKNKNEKSNEQSREDTSSDIVLLPTSRRENGLAELGRTQ